jgi:iron complex outermembrane recepter protein
MYSAKTRAFSALLLFLACASAARADRPILTTSIAPGTITGVVQDSAGAPLPGAQVVLTQLRRGTTTDRSGRFVFRELRPGTYHVDAVMIGYAPGHTEVTVADGATANVTLKLRVAAVQLSGIQVTASPVSTEALAVAQATTEVAGNALQRALGASIAQTLETQPGIANRSAGPSAALPVIRGLTGERILVLNDGERTADLSAASADHALSVDPLAATRIEVVRGPASLLYGNSALGGVVNVISSEFLTAIPQHPSGYLSFQGETVNPGGAGSGALALPISSTIALTARGGARRLDDVRIGGGVVQENTFSRNAYGVLGFGLVKQNVSWSGSGQVYGFNYGLPAAPEDEEAGIHLEGRRTEAQSRAELALGDRGLQNLQLSGTAQWYNHDEIEASGEVGTSFSLRTQTAELKSKTAFGKVAGQVGVSLLWRQYEATGEEALTPPANSNSVGGFLFQEIPLRARHGDARVPTFQIGGRYDHYSTDSKEADEKFGPARSVSFGNVSASVGVSLPVGSNASVGLSIARAFRAPTVEELFSNAVHAAVGAFQRGNPDLNAETNGGLDGVLRVEGSRSRAQISAYFNWINNYIAPITVKDTLVEGEDLPLQVFQQADASIRGVEAQAEREIVHHFVIGVMGDALRGEFRDGAGPLPFMPAARIGGSARWDTGRSSVGALVRHAFRQDRVPENETVAGAYTLVNLTASTNVTFGGRVHSFTLRVDNLMDEHYREATSRIKDFAFSPGRNFSLSYRIVF